MTSSRLESFRAMVARSPGNALARFGLASEAYKAGELEEARVNYEAYLAAARDEGNAYGKLAEVLHALGHSDEAKASYRRGIEAALSCGHPGMAAEFEERLAELGEG